MKRIVFLIILCLFLMPFNVKAEEVETPEIEEKETEVVNVDSYINELKLEYEEIKKTQTYALVIFIGGGIGAIIGAYSFIRKKLNKVDSLTTDVNVSTTTTSDIVANLGKIVGNLSKEVNDLKNEVTPLKKGIENTEKICSIAFLNDPKLVETGQASEIGKVIDYENNN